MSRNLPSSFVISIGCGTDQVPLIKAAQSLGLKVLGVDRENGRGLVDELILESTYDTTTILETLSRRKESEYVKGVLCRSSASAVVTADAVARLLSLPRCGSSVAQSSLSKSILCETSKKLDIPTIPILALCDLDFTVDSFRCVVKPDIPKMGKKNVFLVGPNTLHAALIAAEADSLNSKAIIQPFVEGEDIIVFAAFQFGKVIWYDLFSEKNKFVSTKINHSGLAALSDTKYSDLEARLIPIAECFAGSARASGFVSFSFRIENNGNCFLYEVNPGLCGDEIAEKFLPHRWHADFFKTDVAIMIGSTVPKINRKN